MITLYLYFAVTKQNKIHGEVFYNKEEPMALAEKGRGPMVPLNIGPEDIKGFYISEFSIEKESEAIAIPPPKTE